MKKEKDTFKSIELISKVEIDAPFLFTEKLMNRLKKENNHNLSPINWMINVLFKRKQVVLATITSCFIGIALGLLINLNHTGINNEITSSEIYLIEDIYLSNLVSMTEFFETPNN